MVDVDRAGSDAGRNAVVAQHRALHLGGARHAGADDIRPLSYVLGGVGPRRARVQQRRRGVPTQVVDGEVEARRGYLSRHRAADVPDADESDSHFEVPPVVFGPPHHRTDEAAAVHEGRDIRLEGPHDRLP